MAKPERAGDAPIGVDVVEGKSCLLYTSDAADEEDSVDLGGRRIIKKNFANSHPTNVIKTTKRT